MGRAWTSTHALPLADKSLDLGQVSLLLNALVSPSGNNSSSFKGLLGEGNEMVQMQFLAQCLARSGRLLKHSGGDCTAVLPTPASSLLLLSHCQALLLIRDLSMTL